MKSIFRFTLMLLLVGVLAGCGTDDCGDCLCTDDDFSQNDPNNPNNPSQPPLNAPINNAAPFQAIATFPLNGTTGVAVNVQPMVGFNHLLDNGPISAQNVILREGGIGGPQGVIVPANFVRSPGNIINIVPTGNLKINTIYTVEVTVGIEDSNSVHLTAPLAFSFTTGTGTSTSPTTPSTGTPTATEIASAGIQTRFLTDTSKAVGAIQGKAFWNGSWQKQVIVFNSVTVPPLTHPVWRYVLDLVVPTTPPATGASPNFGIQDFNP